MQKQRGFIQNLIIPGLVLIGVVLAGLAVVSASNNTNVDAMPERAALRAQRVMWEGVQITDAIKRAEADGAIPNTQGFADVSNTGPLVAGKYLGQPVAAIDGLSGSGSLTYSKHDYQVQAGGADLGTPTFDDLFWRTIGGDELAAAVCQRINNRQHGTGIGLVWVGGHNYNVWGSVLAGVAGGKPGVPEGCVIDFQSGMYSYYRVVNIR